MKAGSIAFSVYAKQADENGNLKIKWHTTFAIGKILDTLPDGKQITKKYADVIGQLLKKMEDVEKIATPEAMQGYANKYLAEHPAELDETLTDNTKAAPAGMVGELKSNFEKISDKLANLEDIVNKGQTETIIYPKLFSGSMLTDNVSEIAVYLGTRPTEVTLSIGNESATIDLTNISDGTSEGVPVQYAEGETSNYKFEVQPNDYGFMASIFDSDYGWITKTEVTYSAKANAKTETYTKPASGFVCQNGTKLYRNGAEYVLRSMNARFNSAYAFSVSDSGYYWGKGCMEEGYRIETKGKKKGEKVYPTASTKSRIKSLFNLMMDYALEYEIVDKNYARTFDVSSDIIKEKEESARGHIIFSDDEMKQLWENVNQTKYVDWILIQCYMGWRPQELAILELNDVDLENWTITGGMKTDAGKQRTVPIHSKIKDLVKANYEFAQSIGSDYLFNAKGQTHAGSWKLTYDKYANRFMQTIKALGMNENHRPHDPRKTFVTMAKKSGMDDYAIKAIVGHKAQDITESAYTERDIEWLRNDIEKIK